MGRVPTTTREDMGETLSRYGPPGTGKSSWSLSIAGERDLDIYILNLSTVR
jgi:replication-associated recombination protein RarA